MTQHIIGIDPSIVSLGFAKLTNHWICQVAGLRQKAGSTAQSDYLSRALAMCDSTCALICSSMASGTIASVVLEVPANWSDSRGQSSKDSEAVQKLYSFTGMLIGAMMNLPCVESIWVTRPRAWKGTTPKDIMVARAASRLRSQGLEHGAQTHDADEAMLLAWAGAEAGVGKVLPDLPQLVPYIRGPFELLVAKGVLALHTSISGSTYVHRPSRVGLSDESP